MTPKEKTDSVIGQISGPLTYAQLFQIREIMTQAITEAVEEAKSIVRSAYEQHIANLESRRKEGKLFL